MLLVIWINTFKIKKGYMPLGIIPYTQKQREKYLTILSKKKKLILLIALSVSILTILYYHSVDKTLTKDDYEYIPKYLINVNQISKESTYQEELDFISSVQRSTFDIAPNSGSIPFNQQREPKELYIAKVAGCSDRARLIEKILMYSGFKTRHFSMYSKEHPPFIISSNLWTILSLCLVYLCSVRVRDLSNPATFPFLCDRNLSWTSFSGSLGQESVCPPFS